MQDFSGKNILVGISGGIAAYKTAYLVRELMRLGATVRVVMTQAAQAFITPMTFQALTGNTVRTDLFDEAAERAMGHIELARWADYLLIAPATANRLAKMAHGIADDLLSTLMLVTEAPVVVCPAMNRSMWAHAATQANCEVLRTRGVVIVEPESGDQACGELGVGRLPEVAALIDALRLHDVSQLLAGQHVLITAGPTEEPIDPVRYISNRSSGKMGYALARAAKMAGAKVTLVSGPCHLEPPLGVTYLPVVTAEKMYQAVMANLNHNPIFIATAAVADYRITEVALEKIKKSHETVPCLQLTENADILMAVASTEKASYVVGFAAETDNVISAAKEKLQRKNLDMIIANQVGDGKGFERDDNEVTVITPTSEITLPLVHKTRLAGKIVALIAKNLQNTPLD